MNVNRHVANAIETKNFKGGRRKCDLELRYFARAVFNNENERAPVPHADVDVTDARKAKRGIALNVWNWYMPRFVEYGIVGRNSMSAMA